MLRLSIWDGEEVICFIYINMYVSYRWTCATQILTCNGWLCRVSCRQTLQRGEWGGGVNIAEITPSRSKFSVIWWLRNGFVCISSSFRSFTSHLNKFIYDINRWTEMDVRKFDQIAIKISCLYNIFTHTHDTHKPPIFDSMFKRHWHIH